VILSDVPGGGAYSVERITFESRDTVVHLRPTSTPWREFYAADAAAAQVLQIPRS